MNIELMKRNYKIYFQLLLLIIFLNISKSALAQERDIYLVPVIDSRYPEDAKRIEFRQIGDSQDSLEMIHEIDIFKGSQVPVGHIVDMVAFGDNFYFADRIQSNVHVINRSTLQYIKAIGNPVPDEFRDFFGLYSHSQNIFIGTNAESNSFNRKSGGVRLISYKHNNVPPLWFISLDINNTFIADSFAYVTKAISDNGEKVIQYTIRGGEANKTVNRSHAIDLPAYLDSAMRSKVITNFFQLKSNKVDSLFYTLPTKEYLIASYDMEGVKQESIDLKSIPEIDRSFNILKKHFNSYFQSATIDHEDTIYFPILVVDDPESELSEETSVSFMAINLQSKTYRTYKMEARGVSPLKVIDGKLWCYDYVKSRLVVYQLPRV